ncbi:hypothetical protein [Sphingomonas sp.]|uniref:hypothetical protein n=1 Tax=Sphingomonas sp. TaxID=28214 RepID=UPI003D6D3271
MIAGSVKIWNALVLTAWLSFTLICVLVVFEVIAMPRWGMWVVGAMGVFNLATFGKGLYARRAIEPTGTVNG